jgi:hypothetical protein
MRALRLALCALALSACDRQEPTIDRGELGVRWARTERCLIGETPLAEGEKASERMAASELTLLARGEEPSWPASCTKLIEDTLALLDAPGGEAHAELRSALRLLGGTQPDMFLSGGDDKYVDQLFAAAKKAELIGKAGDADEGPVAPEPAAAAKQGDLTAFGKTGGLVERVELAPQSGSARFALGDGAGGLYCALDGKPPFSRARCDAVTGERSALFRPLSTEGTDARFYWDFRPKPAVYEVGGESHELPSSASAFVFEEGVIADVVDERPRPLLVRRLTSGRIDRAPLRPPPGARLLGFRGGALLWRGPKRGHGVSPLIAQNVRGGRIALTGEREIGEVPPTVEHLVACRHGDRLTMAIIAGAASEGDTIPVAIATRIGEQWNKPITTSAPIGPRYRDNEAWWRDLTCGPTGAVLTFLREDDRIGQLRCDDDKCESVLGEKVPSVGRVTSQRVTALGDKVLLVRSVSHMAPMTGITDFVTMHLAPLAELASAAPRVMLGDDKHGGLPGIAKAVGLVGGGEAAVALIRSNDAIHGLRVDQTGSLGPLSP